MPPVTTHWLLRKIIEGREEANIEDVEKVLKTGDEKEPNSGDVEKVLKTGDEKERNSGDVEKVLKTGDEKEPNSGDVEKVLKIDDEKQANSVDAEKVLKTDDGKQAYHGYGISGICTHILFWLKRQSTYMDGIKNTYLTIAGTAGLCGEGSNSKYKEGMMIVSEESRVRNTSEQDKKDVKSEDAENVKVGIGMAAAEEREA